MGTLIAWAVILWVLSLFIRRIKGKMDEKYTERELKIYEEKLKLDEKFKNKE